MDQEFIKQRIEKTKLLIATLEDAVTALTSGGVQSYTIDTGQTRQTVTRIDMASINKNIDALYNRLATLEARLNGGSVISVPAW